MDKFEAIIVGAGHAGIEATFALANKGHKVALITFNLKKIATMPCNPSIGGPAKGIITKEIDALGGVQGIYSDKAMVQIKMLNQSKGPAVRALRAQIDKKKFTELIADDLKKHVNISMIEASVADIIVENNQVTGVILENKNQVKASIVIITTGTYMNSYVLTGLEKKISGPDGQKTSFEISKSLKKLGIKLQRLKTGTPPRIKTSSIDFSQVDKEIIPQNNLHFSNRSGVKLKHQMHCYITYTNEKTHQIIDKHLKESSMYSGAINGVGPRYCPSIEDKIIRFRDKQRHQIFYEPETLSNDVTYVNGLSTSMPIYVQKKMIKTLPGMINAEVVKWAYAIEYDAINPLQLKASLELKKISGLFFAGQVNGTSGYEEAAGQGLIAGINAALKIEKKDALILARNQAYIGVLIDDLVLKGTREPYRMLTSRAEYRLLLRNDNADERLSKIGFEIGLISLPEYTKIKNKYSAICKKLRDLKTNFISPKSQLGIKYSLSSGLSYLQLLIRPEVNIKDIDDFKYMYEVSVHARLKGYIEKQKKQANKMLKLDKLKIPNNFNFNDVKNLATEAKVKLLKIKPTTIGQASRISGVNPADIQMILFHMEFRKVKNEN